MILRRLRTCIHGCFILLTMSAAHAETTPLPAAITAEEYIARRERVLENLRQNATNATLLLRAHPRREFAGDVQYPYRPENNLLYLTGLTHQDCALLISATDWSGLGHQVLFFSPEPEFARRWHGKGWTREEASRVSGFKIEALQPLEVLAGTLGALAPASPHGHPPIAAAPPRPFFFDTATSFAPGAGPSEPYAFLLSTLGSQSFHLRLASPSEVIQPLRHFKSEAELALLQKAIDATCVALRQTMQTVRPGLFERQVASRIETAFVDESCRSWAFPSIVGSGPNSVILHHEAGFRRLADGDLLLLDVGAEYGFYAADVTRTIPVSGTFSPRQRQIYELVLRAQTTAIAAVRPGQQLKDIHAIAKAELARGLIELKLIEKNDELRKYYPHGTCHSLGLNVHDALKSSTPLEAGMVITVEPGLYMEDEGFGIRIEDDLLVTQDGATILSDCVPRTIEGIEELLRTGRANER